MLRLLRPAATTLLVAVFVALTVAAPVRAQERPRNVILFVADGTGPATLTMARDYKRDHLGTGLLALDSTLVGAIRTYSTSARVTDSAAGATAFSAGVKTYNGAIAVDTLRRPVGTVLEAAEDAGLATGLVATSRITHATPAAFAAHVPSRSMENEIAVQMLATGVDVVIGGGRRHFVPAAEGGRRDDGRDLLEEARTAGFTVATDRAGYEALDRAPALALLAPDHLAYEIDRDASAEPSLAEMTLRAIDLLEEDEDGFFLLVEASRIDHAGHANDAAAHLRDALAYDEAVAAALAWAEADGETLIVATSDHETGGLSLGRDIDGVGVYAWRPEVLAAVDASFDVMGEVLAEGLSAREVLSRHAGVDSLGAAEEALLAAAEASGDERLVVAAIGDIVSRRAVVGWTTHGHSAVDVSLYAYGPGAEAFVGHHDNTAVGTGIATMLGLDLEAVTDRLRASGTR